MTQLHTDFLGPSQESKKKQGVPPGIARFACAAKINKLSGTATPLSECDMVAPERLRGHAFFAPASLFFAYAIRLNGRFATGLHENTQKAGTAFGVWFFGAGNSRPVG